MRLAYENKEMNDNFKDDTFLARWLNNELTAEELKNFKASEDYVLYEKIVAGASTIQSKEFDEEKMLDLIKAKRSGYLDSRSSRRMWLYGAAASIVVILSFVVFNLFSKPELVEVISEKGEKKTLILPDGSEVILNANSAASYFEDDWEENRFVNLTGEAYFKVKTGNRFTVKTGSGNVSVLGTQFNVQAINGFFEVKCFEGSVQVESGEDDEVLKPKRAYRRINRTSGSLTTFNETAPSWTNNESSFASVPIKYVLIALENQYNITFQGKTAFNDLTFSGTFPHNDLDVALRVVLGSLQIDYTAAGNGIVTLED